MKTPAHIRYAARRLRIRAPEASAADAAPLGDLQKAVNADYVARTFHDAAAIILQEAIAEQRSTATAPPAHIASA